MIRRAFRQVSVAAVVSWGWHHRASVVRAVDLAARMPDRLRHSRLGDAVTEAKAVVRLDGGFPTDVRVRLESLADGTVVLRDGVDAHDLTVVRELLAPLAGIVDVRTDVAHQPTLADALAS